jgi:hypothetical protein
MKSFSNSGIVQIDFLQKRIARSFSHYDPTKCRNASYFGVVARALLLPSSASVSCPLLFTAHAAKAEFMLGGRFPAWAKRLILSGGVVLAKSVLNCS